MKKICRLHNKCLPLHLHKTIRQMKAIRNILRPLAIALTIASATVIPVMAMPSESMSERVLHKESAVAEVKLINGGIDIVVSADISLPVTIFAITGKEIKSFTAQYGSNTVELPAGYYIVRIGKLSYKVIVR